MDFEKEEYEKCSNEVDRLLCLLRIISGAGDNFDWKTATADQRIKEAMALNRELETLENDNLGF